MGRLLLSRKAKVPVIEIAHLACFLDKVFYLQDPELRLVRRIRIKDYANVYLNTHSFSMSVDKMIVSVDGQQTFEIVFGIGSISHVCSAERAADIVADLKRAGVVCKIVDSILIRD